MQTKTIYIKGMHCISCEKLLNDELLIVPGVLCVRADRKKGVPVRWVIKGDNITGCTNKIIIPSLGISQALNAGDNIVRFTPNKAGEIPFSCWMGMVRGKFVVSE